MRHERDWPVSEALRPERLFHHAATAASYFGFVPAGAGPATPVVVSVHGISRNSAEHLFRLSALARSGRFALVVPVFDKATYGQYQQVVDPRKAVRADESLLAMLKDFSGRTGINTARVVLTGFSGGGQFAHRFAMMHADRVAACLPCSAGWYSFPDAGLAFPAGIGTLPLHPQWDAVPIHVVVGGDDTRRDPSLNTTPAIDAQQGRHRLTRARRWTRALQQYRSDRAGAGGVHLTVAADVGHDFADLAATEAFASALGDALTTLQG
ncbi:Poly3-Hydroxybutyrate Depolymerase [Asticcacaulis biprosthecium C19]|uniref:Poly3-Hydroxybutyrate Depolymerase n=1 Tax=Asticcacaulis biprosthecium C19 TaxID=715226 RepID=F4QIU2_9CAUL|nr:poly(3-hydroxybutyrate) depolymerase [Asticcacaulis biprosthecium]EGF91851.1 Poly3-Hydroxybutyrate Depolymerase [Asticcacaulis biprosthecium C19]